MIQPMANDCDDRPTITWTAFSAYAFGYLCGCPDYTIPVGEVPYESRITSHQEYLPVSLSMLSRRGNVSYSTPLSLSLRELVEKARDNSIEAVSLRESHDPLAEMANVHVGHYLV